MKKMCSIEIWPCFQRGAQTIVQYEGPDKRTSLWQVVTHWTDGTAAVSSWTDETAAIAAAQDSAKQWGCEIEPYPWVIALCNSEGWEVVPFDRADNTGLVWRFHKEGQRYPMQGFCEWAFDAWRACLNHAVMQG